MDVGRFKKKEEDKAKWVDWLSDTAPPLEVQEQQIKHRRQKQGGGRYVPRVYDLPDASKSTNANPVAKDKPKKQPKPAKDAADDANISISISLPELHMPDLARLRRRVLHGASLLSTQAKNLWKRAQPVVRTKLFIGWFVATLVVVLLWGLLVFNKQHLDKKHTAETAKKSTTSSTKTVTGTGGKTPPPFTPVVPATKPELTTPDGTHSRYDPTKGNYSYYDSLAGNKTFVVSQQKLPSSAAAAQAAASAAKSLKASSELKSGWGTVYLVQNTKYKSETMAFSVRDMLVFIQASFTVSDDTWIDYINALQ